MTVDELHIQQKQNKKNLKTPKHVAIIMDGNGRWAQKRGWPRFFGHLKGVKTAKKIIRAANQAGIPYLTLFTFSMENWARPKEEVHFLIKLIERHFKKDRQFLISEQIKIKVIGHQARIPEHLHPLIQEIEAMTQDHQGIQVNLAISYSGQQELLDAINKLIQKDLQQVSEHTLRDHFYLPDLPDPDLLIRTGGEFRISNFLIWQLAYTELYFTDALWPEFQTKHLNDALNWFHTRNRRFGNI